MYTSQEIGEHNTETDCWIRIRDKVYDVTKYLDIHPGGREVITDVAGEDATGIFEDIGHSKRAWEQLDTFQVGTATEPAPLQNSANTTAKSNQNVLVWVIVIATGVIIALVLKKIEMNLG